jgi:hypothetical protein
VCVSWRRAVRLICAGWLPQDGLFGWEVSLSRSERGHPRLIMGMVVHSQVADPPSRGNQDR